MSRSRAAGAQKEITDGIVVPNLYLHIYIYIYRERYNQYYMFLNGLSGALVVVGVMISLVRTAQRRLPSVAAQVQKRVRTSRRGLEIEHPPPAHVRRYVQG